MRLIVGIDEVGRGPLAGPVSIGIVVCKKLLVMPELTDSKKMTEEARERVYALAREREREAEILFGVFSASATVIDEVGIEDALCRIIAQGLRELVPEADSAEVILDGRLHAPKEYRQQCIIGGDILVPAISLAAVVAKVERDHHMVRMATKYPDYGFEEHKGYGTARHIRAIQEKGPSTIHRITFLKNIIGATMLA